MRLSELRVQGCVRVPKMTNNYVSLARFGAVLYIVPRIVWVAFSAHAWGPSGSYLCATARTASAALTRPGQRKSTKLSVMCLLDAQPRFWCPRPESEFCNRKRAASVDIYTASASWARLIRYGTSHKRGLTDVEYMRESLLGRLYIGRAMTPRLSSRSKQRTAVQ